MLASTVFNGSDPGYDVAVKRDGCCVVDDRHAGVGVGPVFPVPKGGDHLGFDLSHGFVIVIVVMGQA